MYKDIWISNGGFIPDDVAEGLSNYINGK